MAKHRIHSHIAFCAQALNGRVPDELRLVPSGEFRGMDGRPEDAPHWISGVSDAEQIVSMLKQRQVKLVIDYEHQTLHKEKNGQPAPAAATFSGADMEVRNGEIWATNVQWTQRARDLIACDEYLYISPVFFYERGTGRVLGIHSAGLTNTPNLEDAPELMAAANQHLLIDTSTTTPPTEAPELNEILAALGLGEEATEADIVAAIEALQQALQDAQEASASANDFDEKKAAANNAATPDPSQFAPVAVVQSLQTQLADLTSRMNTDQVTAMVSAAITAGKLLPAQKDWAMQLGANSLKSLQSYIDTAPAIAGLHQDQSGGIAPDNGGVAGLTPSQVAICTQMGISHEDYKAQLGGAA